MPRTHKTKAAPSARRKPKAHAADAVAENRANLRRGLWSGTLSFGLVTIPVELHPATHSTRRSLRMLAPDGVPLARRYFTEEGKALESDDLTRGFELDDGRVVVVEDEELERLLPEQSRDIDLSRFVPVASIPPLYFERAYILVPAQGGTSAYRLLASSIERLGKAGIATFVMRERQYIVAITAHGGVLWAETLRFSDELRDKHSVGLEARQASAGAVREMRAAIKGLRKARVSERELEDRFWQRLEKLVAKKRAEKRDVVEARSESTQEDSGAEVIDLMQALQKSLAKSRAS